ncbi:hypothetical protein BC332_01428 [Capsicum chinense]|nr:hypothetical protein BC332_01428 [Capsicum chinense]
MTRHDNHVSFQLNLNNGMKDKSIRYNDITLNFYYGTNTSYPIGNYTFDGFKQGKDKEAFKSGMIETYNMPWDDAIKAVSNGSKASFRVDVSSRIRYKITFWYTKRHNYFVENKVEVDDTGGSKDLDKVKWKQKKSREKHERDITCAQGAPDLLKQMLISGIYFPSGPKDPFGLEATIDTMSSNWSTNNLSMLAMPIERQNKGVCSENLFCLVFILLSIMAPDEEIPQTVDHNASNSILAAVESMSRRIENMESSFTKRMENLEDYLDSTNSTPQNSHASTSGHARNISLTISLKTIHKMYHPQPQTHEPIQ